MGRNIVNVICEMIKAIPQDEIIVGGEVGSFAAYLERISRNATDCPENEQWKLWGRLSNLIYRYNYLLETEDGKWGKKVIELLIDGPIEKYNKPSQPRRRPRDGQSLCNESEDRRAVAMAGGLGAGPLPNCPSNLERLALSAVTTTAPLSHSQLLERLCADLGSSQIAPILHSEFVLSQIMRSDWEDNMQIIGRIRGPNSDRVMVVRLSISRESVMMLGGHLRSSMRYTNVEASTSLTLAGSRIIFQRLISAGARIVAYSPAYNFTGREWLNDSER